MKPKTNRDRILELLGQSEIELTPKQISVKLGINHHTVRVLLRKLLMEGKVVQPYKGAYCSKITYGMMVSPLRVHNVCVQVLCPWLGFSGEVVEWFGDIKLRVLFGLQRRRVTGWFSCDSGMDYRHLVMVFDRFCSIVEERTGRPVEKVVVKTFEVNRDFHGVRLDGGLKCFTRQGFLDFIERVYQKDASTVRAEVKVSKELGVEDLLTLMHGGMPSFEISQGVFVLSQKVEKLTEAIKFQNELLSRIVRVQEALMNEVVKLKEKIMYGEG